MFLKTRDLYGQYFRYRKLIVVKTNLLMSALSKTTVRNAYSENLGFRWSPSLFAIQPSLDCDFKTFASFATDEALRLFVADNLFGFRIPFDFSTKSGGDAC